MRYLLDTNAWIWLFSEPQKIRTEVRRLLNQEGILGLSPMSIIIEVAQKASKGKLIFRLPLEQWVNNALPPERLRLMPLTTAIALGAYQWAEDFHGDIAAHRKCGEGEAGRRRLQHRGGQGLDAVGARQVHDLRLGDVGEVADLIFPQGAVAEQAGQKD